MSLSRLALEQSRLVYLTVGALLVFGAVSYFTLPAREDPHITVREAVVLTESPGLSAGKVERLVTRTLEEAIRNVSEIEEIRSTSLPERSIIHAEVYDTYFDLEQIWDEVRHELEEARPDLPEGVRRPKLNDDFGEVAVVTAALTGEDFTPAELWEYAKFARDRLYAVDGTRTVEILGQIPERVHVEIDETRLNELDISPRALAAQLRNRNVLGARGTLHAGDRRLLVKPSGSFESVSALEELLVELPGAKNPIRLADVATVRRGYAEPPERLAYVNGDRALVLAVSMLPSERVLAYGPRVLERLDELRRILPVGVNLEVVTHQAEQVAKTVYGVTANVGQTLAIVLAVVVLFLGLRTGLIVGAIVPGVMLLTLAVMGIFEMPLQRMSLATLVIALGLLVDNGIVVAEDFKRRLEEGAARDQALDAVGRELALPLLASTLTTILVFLPLMLAEHVSGEYTRSISLVILISLLGSWLLAMTFTPLLCHAFIRPRSDEGGSARAGLGDRAFGAVNRHYERLLRRTLRHPVIFLAVMALGLVGAIAAMAYAPKKFFPDSDRTQVLAYVDLEPEASIEATDRAIQSILALLEDDEAFPHVESHAGYVGFGGPRFVLSLAPIDRVQNRGFIVANVDDGENMSGTIRALRAAISREVPEVEAQVKRMFLGPSDSSKIEIQAKGPDREVVYHAALEIEGLLREVPNTIDIRSDWEGLVPQIEVEVDQAEARRSGVTSADVARALERALSGQAIAEFRDGDDVFPIVLRATEAPREDLSRLRTLSVSGDQGAVPLAQVARVGLEPRHARIAREDLERTATVEGRNLAMTAEDMVPRLEPKLDALRETLPPGHTIELDGVVVQSAEGQAALQANLPLCLGLMVLLLVGQFKSYRRPLIIMGTIPLLLIGAVIGLYVMQANFGFMVMLGLYSLAGIIINNAIVLIDRIDIDRATSPRSDFESVVSASVRRLRPIVMTMVTTVLGLLPLIVFEDALFYGMASAMAFGLLVGTVLTLGVVPAAYRLLLGIKPPKEATS